MSDITLSSAVRSNLLSLQNTADLMATTQNRLATGKKVNSALDNPTNFFTASSLNSRAGDINQLMDGMANGIQTIEAADNGLTAITKTLESMQSTLRQARQDKSFETGSFSLGENGSAVTLSNGSLGGEVTVGVSSETGATAIDTADVTGGKFTISVGNTAVDIDVTASAAEQAGPPVVPAVPGSSAAEVAKSINDNATLKSAGISAEVVTGGTEAAPTHSLKIVNSSGKEVTLTNTDSATDVLGKLGFANDDTIAAQGTDSTTDVNALVRAINSRDDTKNAVRASNDDGKLRIENLSTTALNVETTDTSSEIGGNKVRADLADQYNELRDQLDKLADDASFNGINLLRGDNLKITFNENATSELEIQSKDGMSINADSLGLKTNMEASDLDSDTSIDDLLAGIKTAVNTVRSQSSAFGSSLSIVENRQDFSKNMINTLETGAANLTLADSNEEAANLLALQTRQQLSSTALSMASQQDQAVLRLF